MPSYIWIYLIVICILVIVYMIFYTHRKRITKTLTRQMDSLLYLYDKNVYLQKDTIHDYQDANTLLFHNQVDLFTKGKEYLLYLPKLLQDIVYMRSLTQETIVDDKTLKSIAETYQVWEKLHNLKKYTHTILIIFTLGIAKLFLP